MSLVYWGRRHCFAIVILALASYVAPSTARAQDLLGDNIGFSGATLNFQRYANIPTGGNKLISITTQPAATGNRNLFVTTTLGTVYSLAPSPSGITTPTPWFEYNTAVNQSVSNAGNGFVLANASGTHGGLRSVAFHPEFATNGKFYTSAMIDRPNNGSVGGLRYLGVEDAGFDAESVVAEWTYDNSTGQLAPNSYRELFRVAMPVFDHPIKQIAFNNFAQPGDEDYGLLYVTHGDGSIQSATAGGGQNTNDALGKVLRVNPLQNGSNPYTTPNNPFGNGLPSGSSDAVLSEIYALGFRNPHQISFAQDGNGGNVSIVGETGRDNVEEINVLQSGGDFGWSDREGTFVHNASGGYGLNIGVSNLPSNEWQLNDYVYPAAQYDHDANLGAGFVGSAVAGGFTIQNNSDPALQNEYIFADFGAKSGHVYQASLDDLLGAHTQLADGELPSALTQAPISRLMLTLDDNADGAIDRTATSLKALLQRNRNDIRFGRGPNGEMFATSKQTGAVYLVTNTVRNDLLTLEVDRNTGEVAISNLSEIDIQFDGINIMSPSSSLTANQFQLLGSGWSTSAGNSPATLSQLREDGVELLPGANQIHVGNVFTPQLVAFGESTEDLLFSYTSPDGITLVGEVVYTGESSQPNTIVLTVDRVTGEVFMQNQTPFAQEVEAYKITSEANSIAANNWNSLEDQNIDDGTWSAASAAADFLLEAQEDGTTTFDEATVFALGQIFNTSSAEDLLLEFLIAGEVEQREGQVQYILAGDYNDDGTVDAADYTVWRDNLGEEVRLPNDMTPGSVTAEDYLVWQTRFGASAATLLAASASAVAVPEPTTLVLLFLSSLSIATTGRRRRV